jgi:hypothetical protein
LTAGPDGLTARCQAGEVAAAFHRPGALPEAVLALPLDALADCSGAGDAPVTLTPLSTTRVEVGWIRGGVPCTRVSDTARLPTSFPEPPSAWAPQPPGLFTALASAAPVAAREGTRYALHRLQLRGSRGEVVATDGQQLLVQGGFAFPWTDDVLVADAGMLAAPELPGDAPVAIGRTATHVWVRVEPWSFALAIDTAGRFPDVSLVIPRARADATRLVLDAGDAAALASALPALPGADDEHRPVTLDLNGHAVVRARAADQPRATEVDLARSTVLGPPLRLATDRGPLARALRLGFTEFSVAAADKPVVGRDAQRTYLWMTLAPAGALPPDPEARRVTLPPPAARPTSPARPRSPRHMPTNRPDDPPARRRTEPAPEPMSATRPGVGTLIDEAQGLQRALREAGGRAARLATALRRHRRRSKLVQSTLASLKQIPLLEP